ncbi:MAG TPA: NAD(P)-dependent oxidoreductase [Acidimicrobiales bacterium]|nr:NAD(P)-dependent oxidoreductase [Acidimicrobiales bacterium]
MSDRLALVTGGTGYIASHLVPALTEAGWSVRTTGRRARPDSLPEAVEYQPADLAGGAPLALLLDGVTHLFHLAGASSSRSDADEMLRSNVVGTERLLTAAVAAGGPRVLHMSSTSVYGEEVQLPLPVKEDVEPRPSRGYGKAKWEGEQIVWRFSRSGLPVSVVRPVSVHGPGAVKLLASAILDVVLEKTMGVDAVAVHRVPIEQRLVHIDDLVSACLHLIDHDAAVGRPFNVVSGVYPTSIEVATVLAREFGLPVELSDDPECGPSYEDRRLVRERFLDDGMNEDIILSRERFRFMRKANRNNRLSIDALLATGFRPAHTDLAGDVAELTAWYRDRRWIPTDGLGR